MRYLNALYLVCTRAEYDDSVDTIQLPAVMISIGPRNPWPPVVTSTTRKRSVCDQFREWANREQKNPLHSLKWATSMQACGADEDDDPDVGVILLTRSDGRSLTSPAVSGDDFNLVKYEKFDFNRSPLIYLTETEKVPDLKRRFDLTPFGMITPAARIGRTQSSTVHTLAEDAWNVVKYQIDCVGAQSLEDEFNVLKDIADLGIAPTALYLSPETKSYKLKSDWGNKKTGFLVHGSERKKFARYCNGKPVRFMVMEKIGSDLVPLAQDFTRQVTLNEIGIIGLKILELIRKLHEEARVVHGDIHPGNIAFKHPGNIPTEIREAELVLIDFGRSFNYLTSHPKPIFGHNSPFFSIWEMKGEPSARRDDLYRMLMVLASMVSGEDKQQGGNLYQFFERFNNYRSECERMKLNSNFFTHFRNPLDGMDSTATEKMNTVFQQLFASVRSLTLDMRPNYEQLADLFHIWIEVTA